MAGRCRGFENPFLSGPGDRLRKVWQGKFLFLFKLSVASYPSWDAAAPEE